MPFKLEIKKKLVSRCERVKSVDLHPTLPWVLTSLFSGVVNIHDYSNQTIVKTFEICLSPIRSSKFVVRKQWIVVGADDLIIRVYNYNTMEKIHEFESHADYLRCIVIHPTLPLILSSSDDTTIKSWDWDNSFKLSKTFQNHENYVMQIAISPRDANVFASASLDKSIKLWNINSNQPMYTLNGHQLGVNCVSFHRGEKPYLISGGDDKLIKIWDYMLKTCLHTLEGHQNNLSSVIFHPDLPLIFSSSEDGSIMIWHSATYKLQTTLDYFMERAWCLDYCKDYSNIIAIGYDEGVMVLKIGNDEPLASLNNGKLLIAKNTEIFQSNLKALNVKDENLVKDGHSVSYGLKELGNCDIFPLKIKHSPKGHVFAVVGDSEYYIYKSQNFKNVGFGQGVDLVWSPSEGYAIRDGNVVKIFNSNSTQVSNVVLDYNCDGLFGGALLCTKSSEVAVFYDWETMKVVRRVEVNAKKVIWNDANTKLLIISSNSFFVLSYNKSYVDEVIADLDHDDGLESAFEVLYEIHESISSAMFIYDAVFYTTDTWKIYYANNGKHFYFAFPEKKKMHLLGYVANQERLYLIDKHNEIISYELSSAFCELLSTPLAEYQTKGTKLLSKIKETYYDKIAKYLESMNMKEEAFDVALDKDLKFELAITLEKLQEAFDIANQENNLNKYKQIGDLALIHGRIDMAVECFWKSDDFGGLLLIHSSTGNKQAILELGQKSFEKTRYNIAFTCFFMLRDLQKCLEILLVSKRFPEAAFFARAYLPSKMSEMVELWKKSLQNEHSLTAKKIADPADYSEFDEEHKISLEVEEFLKDVYQKDYPAYAYSLMQENVYQDFYSFKIESPQQMLADIDIIPEIPEKNEVYERVHLGLTNEDESQINKKLKSFPVKAEQN